MLLLIIWMGEWSNTTHWFRLTKVVLNKFFMSMMIAFINFRQSGQTWNIWTPSVKPETACLRSSVKCSMVLHLTCMQLYFPSKSWHWEFSVSFSARMLELYEGHCVFNNNGSRTKVSKHLMDSKNNISASSFLLLTKTWSLVWWYGWGMQDQEKIWGAMPFNSFLNGIHWTVILYCAFVYIVYICIFIIQTALLVAL